VTKAIIASLKGKERAPPAERETASSMSDERDTEDENELETADSILARQVALVLAKPQTP